MNLTAFADSFPHTLSGGMKQRVAIARGMAMEPDILLMDEPFAALDALTRRKMQDELLALWDDTRFTVLFVTHSIPEAIKIGSRILLLSPHPGPGQGGDGQPSARVRAGADVHGAGAARSIRCCSPIPSRRRFRTSRSACMSAARRKRRTAMNAAANPPLARPEIVREPVSTQRIRHRREAAVDVGADQQRRCGAEARAARRARA